MIFGKNSENVLSFSQIFVKKSDPIEQQNPRFRKFFLENAIKHQLLASDETIHSAKILGTPSPRISLMGMIF